MRRIVRRPGFTDLIEPPDRGPRICGWRKRHPQHLPNRPQNIGHPLRAAELDEEGMSRTLRAGPRVRGPMKEAPTTFEILLACAPSTGIPTDVNSYHPSPF